MRGSTTRASVALVVAVVLAATVVAQPASATPRHRTQAVTVNGTYQPFTGDFDGDGNTDVFWYSPNTGTDAIWFPTDAGFAAKTSVAETVNSSYQPVVGDFVNHDHRSDIVWYRPGTASDSLWTSAGGLGKFTSSALSVNGTYHPVVGNFVGNDTNEDIFWFSGVAGGSDALWRSNGNGTFTNVYGGPTMAGAKVLKGNFKGDAADELFFYRAGSASDGLMSFASNGTASFTPMSVSGAYTPIVGDLYSSTTSHTCYPDGGDPYGYADDAENYRDIKWYAPGTTADTGWHFAADGSGTKTNEALTVNGVFRPIVLHNTSMDICDSLGAGTPYVATDEDYVVWYAASAGKASIGTTTYTVPANATTLTGTVGNEDYIFFYRPGTASDLVQYEESYYQAY